MPRDPSYLGTVQDVAGFTVSVLLDEDTGSGLLFVAGHRYRVGQVGSFVRIPIGFSHLIGIVARAGAGAVPERLAGENPFGRRWLTVELIGTGSPTAGFQRGVAVLPSIGDATHLVTEADLSVVYGRPAAPNRISIGRVASAESINALVDINALVARHAAVVGATGSGKSTSVTTILSALTEPSRYPSARVLLFDIHGEYSAALADRATTIRVGAKAGQPELFVPYWALSFDELLPLTFGSIPDDAARGAVRDEIVRLKRESFVRRPLAGLSAHEITVDSPAPFSLHQLWFELHCLVNATHTAGPTAQSKATEALEVDAAGNPIEPGDALNVVPPRYQAATQAAGATKIYLSGSALNIRRQVDALASRLRDRRFDFLFKPGPWSVALDGSTAEDLDTFLEQWLGGGMPITILDLSGVPTTVLTELVGALARIIYDALFWARSLSEGGRERPLLFVFEEAHSYLTPGVAPTALEAVHRVAKEGRKYGMGALIVSQRPSEVDATVLSQCGTLIALRLTNASDRAHVAGAVSDNLGGLLSMLPVLRTGEAIVLGESVPLPTRVLVDLPKHLPDSADPLVVPSAGPGGWDRDREPSDYGDVIGRWRSSDPASNRLT